MREIKFKGRRTDNGERIYGDLMYTPTPNADHGKAYIRQPGWEAWLPVSSDTVGQYTGLKDKNGNQYENPELLQGGTE